MFKGKVTLKSPETNTIIGIFAEVCEDNGTTTAKVELRHPITIEKKQRLEIFSSEADQIIILAETKNGEPKTVHEFSGTSSLGCLPEHEPVSLVRTEGGLLNSLLIVLGVGTIEKQ